MIMGFEPEPGGSLSRMGENQCRLPLKLQGAHHQHTQFVKDDSYPERQKVCGENMFKVQGSARVSGSILFYTKGQKKKNQAVLGERGGKSG